MALEINSFLKRIYSTLDTDLSAPVIRAGDIRLVNANPLKSYEFVLKLDDVKKGRDWRIKVITSGINDLFVRKQRSLFIAAEIYVYHALANRDPRYYERIKGQNQFVDMLRVLVGKDTANNMRDRAVRYVIEELGERHLAHFNPPGWVIRLGKLKRHDRRLVNLLGSSEHLSKRIMATQHENYSLDMLKMEENIVRKELHDVEYLIRYLGDLGKTKHLAQLEDYKKSLEEVKANMHRWLLGKGKYAATDNARHELREHLKAPNIDIEKVYHLIEQFEKEKINILKEGR